MSFGGGTDADLMTQWLNENGQTANWNTTGLTVANNAINPSERTLAIICTGQSNSANWQGGTNNGTPAAAAGPYTLKTISNPTKIQMMHPVDGQLYQLKDPVLGADGPGSSLVSYICDFVINAGYADRVILASGGAGGTNIARHIPNWMSGANNSNSLTFDSGQGLHGYQSHITNMAQRLRSRGCFTPNSNIRTVGMWIQGEADQGMAQTTYENYLYWVWDSIFGLGFPGKVAVAQVSWSTDYATHSNLTSAQANMQNRWPARFITGPNMDAYTGTTGSTYRYDGVHLSTAAQTAYANDWVSFMHANGLSW